LSNVLFCAKDQVLCPTHLDDTCPTPDFVYPTLSCKLFFCVFFLPYTTTKNHAFKNDFYIWL